MSFSLSQVAFTIAIIVNSSAVVAAENLSKNDKDIDVITITHQRHGDLTENQSLALGKTSEPDLASWLASVPGANINRNGPLTGIAQYRGLYGDRVATTINGHTIIGAGPNAMDTPLSYSTPLIVDSMTVYRGIAPVTVAMNTLGGAIDVQMRKAEIANSQQFESTGDLQAGYRSNNQAHNLSAAGNISQGKIAAMVYGNSQAGESMKSGDGKLIDPTGFNKDQFGGDLRYGEDNNQVGLSYHYLKTTDAGTPALPMDIEYIESHRINLDGTFELGQWQANWRLGYLGADHGMTNFLMRANNNESKYRRNTATANTTDFKVDFTRQLSFGELLLGVDGYFSKHDSVITNPNNNLFEVVNFNDVTDDNIALFAQWQNQFEQTNVQLGIRVKQTTANAGKVSSSMATMPMNHNMSDNMNSDTSMNHDMSATDGMHSEMDTMPAMPSMASLAGDLMDDFNNAERKVSDTDVDFALNTQTQLSSPLSLLVGLGIKNRSPSYQERYLWMPMESTGGLADGNTYIGDINLKSETAYQADIGFSYINKSLIVEPHLFYQNIDNYIQGAPLEMADQGARMIANMMAGNTTPLKFTNVDAKLYGVDVNWHYNISANFNFSGVASYVKGERRDIDDNLYRIAPLNSRFILGYNQNSFAGNLVLVAVAAQNDVSVTNNEQKTSGYGVANLDVAYYVDPALTIRAGIDNLLNREYQDHLGGYNRVKETEIPVMSRLPSEGLSAWAEVTYNF